MASDDKKDATAKGKNKSSDSATKSDSGAVETDADAAVAGEAGQVARGDTGLDLKVDSADASGSTLEVDDAGAKPLKNVSEDYVYLAPEHFEGAKELRTSDSDDPHRSWTTQDFEGDDGDRKPVALAHPEGEPGQTFSVDQLPNADVVEKSGIDYVQWVSGLPVRV